MPIEAARFPGFSTARGRRHAALAGMAKISFHRTQNAVFAIRGERIDRRSGHAGSGELAMGSRAIGFPYCYGGITNQKIAISNLFLAARGQNTPIVLPEIFSLDHLNGQNCSLNFNKIFDISTLQIFCAAHGIGLTSGDYEKVADFTAFTLGALNIENLALAGRLNHYGFIAEFLRALRPKILETIIFSSLRNEVFNIKKIDGVVQLRIEKDWIVHSRNNGDPGATDEYLPTFQRIMQKTRNSFPENFSKLYVVCDELALPVPKDEIRSQVHTQYGLELFWKSDFMSPKEIDAFFNVELSLIDFEIAKLSRVFIGLTTSTFSNFITLEKYFCERKSVETHYIYNAPGDFLKRRLDNGAFAKFDWATTRNLADTFLIEADDSHSQIPGSLTAHIGFFGDFSSYGLLFSGISRDPKCHIQGFSIELDPDQSLQPEYCSSSEVGVWGGWVPSGSFAGSRGLSRDLLGYAVRAVNGLSENCEILAVGKFRDCDDIITAIDGAPCVSPVNTPLLSMQIVIRRRNEATCALVPFDQT